MRWTYCFWAMLTIVTWLMLIELAPKSGGWPYWDKVQHVVVFAVLTTLAYLSYAQRWRSVAIGLVVYGAMVEVLQSALTITRQASVGDWLADALGIVCVMACFWGYRRWLLKAT